MKYEAKAPHPQMQKNVLKAPDKLTKEQEKALNNILNRHLLMVVA